MWRNNAKRVGVHELVDCFGAIQSVLPSSFVGQSRVQVREEFLIRGCKLMRDLGSK